MGYIPPLGGGGEGAVSTVNGQTGAVELDAADVGAAPADHTHPADPGSGVSEWTTIVQSADTSTTVVTTTPIVGLSVPTLPDGLYEVEAVLLASAANSLAPAHLGLTRNGNGAAVRLGWFGSNGLAAEVTSWPAENGYPAGLAPAYAPAANQTYMAAVVRGTVRATGMTGSLDFTIKAKTDAQAVTAKRDSLVKFRRVGA